VVITGVSGSGKSSLAFDTLYAEGQRRYVESLSAYARQFIGQMDKPKVDFIGGLSPAIAIEQKAVSKNPRSTVATVTEIYDYLRVLYARIGTAHCPQCGREVHAQSAQEIVDQVRSLPSGTRFQVLAPLARNRKGAFQDTFYQARTDGFARVRVDGKVHDLDNEIKLDKKKKHNIELVVDRLVIPTGEDATPDTFITRLTDSVETALRLGDGMVIIDRGNGDEWLLSTENACPSSASILHWACAPPATAWAPRSSSIPTVWSIRIARYTMAGCVLGANCARRSRVIITTLLVRS